jgi:hypothetical protein
VVNARPICETCGHTREWHDRDAERVRRGSDPPVERPCYREVGGAACGCSGFRESGTFAMLPGIALMRSSGPDVSTVRVGILALLLVVLGLALLYAYRSQTPSIPEIDVSKAVQDINGGRVRAVTFVDAKANLEFRDSPAHKEQTTVPQPDTIVARAVSDYNAAHPAQAIELKYVQDGQPIGLVGSINLSLLPILVIGGLLYYFRRKARDRS